MILQTIWYVLVIVLLIGYAILDGFDLGVGVLHLRVARTDTERRLSLNAIGPFWDGNEVWLLTGGGALFAAFPPVYATVFSGFYLAMILVLFALIMRAISMEFRSKVESPRWRFFWDKLFSLGSFLAALLFGVAVGNLMRGIPLDASGEFTGSFFGLLNPFSLLMGVLSLAMFTMQGAVFLLVKAEDEMRSRAKAWAWKAFYAFVVLHVVGVVWSFAEARWLFDRFEGMHLPWLFVCLFWASVVALWFFLKKDRALPAFAASSAAIATQIAALAAGAFPVLAPSRTSTDFSLTAFNASSSELTLKTMLILALIGVPLVLGYTIWIYWIYRGKSRLEPEGY